MNKFYAVLAFHAWLMAAALVSALNDYSFFEVATFMGVGGIIFDKLCEVFDL